LGNRYERLPVFARILHVVSYPADHQSSNSHYPKRIS
jgi:hypothetical protein